MIDGDFFAGLAKDNATYGSARREIIKGADDVRNLSKRAIFAMHRDDLAEADSLLADAKAGIAELRAKATMPGLEDEGAFRAGLEEYVEARLYRRFIENGTVADIGEDGVGYDTYLGALADVSGEIQRRQVKAAIDGDADEVERLYAAVEAVVGELLKMDLTGHLRNKFDQAKNALRRAEEVRYDVSIRRR